MLMVQFLLSQIDNARRLLPSAVAVEALQQDDAWFRDTGPSVSALKCPTTLLLALPYKRTKKPIVL